jgi:hypothetical protein
MERLARYLECKGERDVPREAIQVLEILLKSVPNLLFHAVNRSTGGGAFFTDYDPVFISGGLVALKGWKQSIRPTFKDILLNLDVATTCYYKSGEFFAMIL